MPYDIGRITRELQQEFRLFKPRGVVPGLARQRVDQGQQFNRATPENIAILLAALDTLTDDLKVARDALGNWTADASVAHWDHDFDAWLHRLDDYIFEVSKAPPGDRQDILWSVTAPLLLGYFGGEDSKLPQQRIDAVTPFVLANQLEVTEQWRNQRWDKLIEDIEQNAGDIAKPVAIGVGTIAAVAVGAWALGKVLS